MSSLDSTNYNSLRHRVAQERMGAGISVCCTRRFICPYVAGNFVALMMSCIGILLMVLGIAGVFWHFHYVLNFRT